MIVLQNVSKAYRKDRVALQDITLSISREEFVFFTGPNGAGKSTLLKLLTLQERPTDGVIVVDGLDTALVDNGKLAIYRRKIGIVFQDTRLFPDRSVFENVSLPLRISGSAGRKVREMTAAGLRTVGLEDFADRRADELSGGELRRVAIARAIVGQPQLLLADEPTDSLSPVASKEIMALLLQISRSGVTTLVATHDRAAVDLLRRRVIRLDDGRVASDRLSSEFDTVLEPA
ncbi:MAG TPA: ATP-binding cassette domain-containing protein [Chloroflexota bacterium]|nr:ATP-binding cassette domain-containing protein [Chloroflexota bacterium]